MAVNWTSEGREEIMDPQTRPRAVFTTDDFRLMRDALAHYLKSSPGNGDMRKAASLYHRLGRVG